MRESRWNDEHVSELTRRIELRFSPVLDDYVTEGSADCPACRGHVVSRCTGPLAGGRIIRLTLECPGCGSLAEREFLEVSHGRTQPCFRREHR
jgi:hypothetical protein